MHPSGVTPRAICLRRSILNARLRFRALALLTSLALAGAGNAQGSFPPPPAESRTEAEPVRLDPLMVTSSASGYGAQLSSSSSRLNIRYVDVPQTVSVVTTEFLDRKSVVKG